MTTAELRNEVSRIWSRAGTITDAAGENIIRELGDPTGDELRWALTRHHANNLDGISPKWAEVKVELKRPGHKSYRRLTELPDWRALIARNREAAPIRLGQATDEEVFNAYLEANTRPLLDSIERFTKAGDEERARHVAAQVERRMNLERRHWVVAHRDMGLEPPAFLSAPTVSQNPLEEIPF